MDLLRAIRGYEAAQAREHSPDGGRLLEIGAGRGHQALYFQELGFRVDAIDVESSSHLEHAVFPVQVYDGARIPFPDETFDVVFSSNVLEHVPACDELLREISRVTKGDGVMLHILPTACWRIWTNLAHYLWVLRLVTSRGTDDSPAERPTRPSVESDDPGRRSLWRLLRKGLFPFRHGIRGNWLTETYFFSRLRWKKTFRDAQLRVRTRIDTGIFYTGYGIPGVSCSMATRSKLARWLGSATALFVLDKRGS